ncbi:leucyl aminopeptidase [Spongiibacter sp.]|uniref:leucyl aminopeptidase n=1 Tax=Spongiibacter sp. TaxID=2024860 RepID=UPI0035635B8F
MQISLKPCKDPSTIASDCLVVMSNGQLNGSLNALNDATDDAIAALLKRGDFSGKLAETLYLPIISGLRAKRLLIVGCGDGKTLSEADADKILNTAIDFMNKKDCKDCCLLLEDLHIDGRKSPWLLQRCAQLLEVSTYRYSETLSKAKPAASLRRAVLQGSNSEGNRRAIIDGQSTAGGINIARRLGDLPGNICTPDFLAKESRKLARQFDTIKVSVLDEKKMQQLGMGALLSVSAGSEQPARLIAIEYQGSAKKQPPHVLVGKGVTFDTGGISLKPGAKMDEMKYDMCGAASVVGTLHAVASAELKVNVVGIVAAAENMPSGRATKPGDVVTSMSGQTIEILNTDAEGRLVLCDALSYADRYKPASVIDIATLTGACVVALGKHAIGLFSNQHDFAQELQRCGEDARDRAWPMPLWDEYQPQLDSNFADMANIGGPEAGSVTAACFLSRFCKDYRWAHLDIAGAAWNSGANKGATGRPVGLLFNYLQSKADN